MVKSLKPFGFKYAMQNSKYFISPKFLFLVAISGVSLGLGAAIPAYAQAVSDTAIESFLGLESGALDGVGNGDVTEGAAIRQTFTGTAGQTLTFDWNFLTNEAPQIETFMDFAFVSVASENPLILGDTNSMLSPPDSPSQFANETGFNTFSFVLPEDGDYTLGLGVVDVGDTIVSSGLLVDNLDFGVNGSFETGDFTGFETIGDTLIADSTFGINPTDGDAQALLTTGVPEPETFLGSVLLLISGVLLKRKVRKAQKRTADI